MSIEWLHLYASSPVELLWGHNLVVVETIPVAALHTVTFHLEEQRGEGRVEHRSDWARMSFKLDRTLTLELGPQHPGTARQRYEFPFIVEALSAKFTVALRVAAGVKRPGPVPPSVAFVTVEDRNP